MTRFARFAFRLDGRLESLDFLCDDAGQRQHANQIWNCHQCVGNIRQIPNEIQRHRCTDKCDNRKDNAVSDADGFFLDAVYNFA